LLDWRPQWAAATTPVPSVQDMTENTIRSLGLQVDLPRVPPLRLSGISVDLPDVVLWAVVVAAVAVMLYSFRDRLWWNRGEPHEPGEAYAQAAARQDGRLAQAEYLAQQGRFVDAMHELLLEGFREIRERAQERLADSLTSREILRATPLPEPGRAALRAMITRVEWTYFGEHAATLADYRACRESFDALRSVLSRAATA
jgi:hypothetical protein